MSGLENVLLYITLTQNLAAQFSFEFRDRDRMEESHNKDCEIFSKQTLTTAASLSINWSGVS